MRRKFIIGILLAVFFAGAILLVSCNKAFDRLINSNTGAADTTNVTIKNPKVLYLIVDGARGWSVRDAGTTYISGLTKKGIYSWTSVSDSLGNDGNAWADLLTGVNKAKHKVIDNTFANNQLQAYPTIIQRIKTLRPNVRVATFASSSVFTNNLTSGADVAQTGSNDNDVTQRIIGELGNSNAGLVIGEFNGVNQAGSQYGYDNSYPAYKSAILQVDQYIGQILTALRARSTYSTENWLIVVTSNHGGTYTIPASQNDGTIFSYPITNTFTVISNDNFKQKFVDKPFTGNIYAGSFLRYYSNPNLKNTDPKKAVQAVMNNGTLAYDFGDTVSFTVEMKVKLNPISGSSTPYLTLYPAIFGKKADRSRGTGYGWGIDMEKYSATQVQYSFFVGTGTGAHVFGKCAPISDGNWHTISFVIYTVGTTRHIRPFLDGIYSGSEGTMASGPINDAAAKLVAGFMYASSSGDNGNNFDGYISDIRIWHAALPDAVVGQYACNTTIDSSHPYWNYLIGYWPCTDGSGTTLKDYSLAHNDFTVNNGTSTTLQWTGLNSIVCPVPTTALSLLVPRNIDLPRQILVWYAIPIADTWNLDGRVWLNN